MPFFTPHSPMPEGFVRGEQAVAVALVTIARDGFPVRRSKSILATPSVAYPASNQTSLGFTAVALA